MARVLLKDVSKIYESGREVVQAVKHLDLEIRDREYLVLLGPSGCGKSSTMRSIAGLERITEGEIYIGDRLVNDLEPKERDVAMAFENYALYPPLTVRENIAYPLRVRGVPESKIREEVRRVAELLEIEDILNRRPRELSGGQKQRVSLGRAVVRRPSVFLLDEPLSHLDASLRVPVRGRLKRLQHELGTTTVHVTHDQLEAVAVADRIAVMNLGELQQVGTPQEIYERPANEFVADFVGEPPINFLEGGLQREDGVLHFVPTGDHFSIALPEEMVPRIEATAPEGVRLGVRPQDLEVSTSPQGDGWIPAGVVVFEWLGEEGILDVRAGDHLIQVLTRPDLRVDEGQQVWLRARPDRLHVFDGGTSRAIR